ncbi:MAG: ABC-F family ATP-binding cassette domain-containing protein [Actinomycetes bacterium]
MAGRNLINVESVTKAYGHRPLLDKVSLGVGEADRIGIVGRNGAGKSTLLRILAQTEKVDDGRVSMGNDVRLGFLRQRDDFPPELTVLEAVVGDRPTHEWAVDPNVREVLEGLLGGFDEELLARTLGTMSGGERRRVDLARLLITDLDVLLLDEPTNHLDVEVIAWLAAYLKTRPRLGLLVVTHDRWFLDEVCENMWEVVNGGVEEYDGGYSAYVLAKAERMRQASVSEQRRNMLIRKELAWLRRGAPARTSKPKFRIDAANELITAEPPPRDKVELLSFADARLGKTVYEVHDGQLKAGDKLLIERFNWNIGPGQRLGVLGSNGAGKTTLIRMLQGEVKLAQGKLVTGVTVKPAYLSQHLEELNPKWRVLEAVEHVANRVDLGKGRELSASQLCERLGFSADSQWTPVGDLSGGERRRLQLTRLLMGGPNVLVLDEPTNDFDIETLGALEDLLDGFAGTLIVISHDRFFLERVCDDFFGLVGDLHLRDLTGGVDDYLDRLRAHKAAPAAKGISNNAGAASGTSAAQDRLNQKEMAKLERQIKKFDERETKLHDDLATHATDFEKVAALNEELREVQKAKEEAEEAWLALAD